MDFDTIDFIRTYKGTRGFVENSPYFDVFLSDLDNVDLQKNIKFCNDYLQIPPTEAYVKYRRDVFCCEMEKFEKQGIGACFGYLFQYGEYCSQYGAKSATSKWVGDSVTGIKNASYFRKK
ncbi:MAG: hypothetical protein R3Y18_05835 [Bacillota bacterium]